MDEQQFAEYLGLADSLEDDQEWGAAEAIEDLVAEVRRLQAVMRQVYEMGRDAPGIQAATAVEPLWRALFPPGEASPASAESDGPPP